MVEGAAQLSTRISRLPDNEAAALFPTSATASGLNLVVDALRFGTELTERDPPLDSELLASSVLLGPSDQAMQELLAALGVSSLGELTAEELTVLVDVVLRYHILPGGSLSLEPNTERETALR
jgi:hypothetical protein